MNAYKDYQAINLPWLKEIPSHWEIRRNKNIFSEMKAEVGERSPDYMLLSLTLNGIIPRNMESGGKFPADFSKYKIVKKGYMAFCLFDIDETPRTVGLSEYDGMLTGAYTIMQVSNINSRYILYYYLALDSGKQLKPLYKGLRKTISIDVFQSTKIPVPPRDEQDQIVRFLDWKVSEINRLVNIKHREFERLEELKKAVVSHLVTRGLTKTTMCVTDIYWLKEIPSKWKTTKLKHILIKQDRPIPENAQLLICSNSGDVRIRGDEKIGLVASSNEIYQGVKAGDLLIHGMDTWHGAIAISNYDGMCTPVVHVCSCTQSKRFVEYYLKMMAYTRVFKAISNGVRQNTSDFRSWDKVGGLLIAFPTVFEQEQIADTIESKIKKIESAIVNKQEQIEKLQELKTRLISDAVTGKIDVRGIEIPEYEYISEETGEMMKDKNDDTEEDFDEE